MKAVGLLLTTDLPLMSSLLIMCDAGPFKG